MQYRRARKRGGVRYERARKRGSVVQESEEEEEGVWYKKVRKRKKGCGVRVRKGVN